MPTYDSNRMRKRNALTRLMLIGFRAAHNEPATEEFLVVQFLHSALRLLDSLHLHKRKTFRALIVPIAYDLCVVYVANAVEQFEEIALRGVEGQVADIKTRRSDFDRLRFAWRSGWLRTVARCCCRFFGAAVCKKCCDPLPECFLLSFRFFLPRARAPIAPASGPTARMARTSPG